MIDCNIAKNYLSEKARMTKSRDVGVCCISCNHCPLSRFNNDEKILCTNLELKYPEKAISIVQKWSNEHPQKIFLTEFLKNYPNAQLNNHRIPGACVYDLGLINSNECKIKHNCVECWNQPIEIEDGESE